MTEKILKKLNKSFLSLALTMVLLLSFISIVAAEQVEPQATSPQRPPQTLTEADRNLLNTIMTFLNDVFKLDTSKYNTDLVRVDGPRNYYDKVFDIYLSSAESDLEITCDIKDNAIIWCKLYPTRGSPIYTTPSLDVLRSAKLTLEDLNAFSPKSYLPVIQNMLNNIEKIENSTITNAEFTQTIDINTVFESEGELVMMSWAPFANGLVHSQNTVALHYNTNGHLVFFSNGLDIFSIGSFAAKVLEQEAIVITVGIVNDFSYEQNGEIVSNFEIRNEYVETRLSLQRRDMGIVLYPCWDVWVPLAEVYPGGVTAFHAVIWADTGDVEYFTATGFYGDLNDLGTINNPQQSSVDYKLVSVLIVIAVAIIAGCIVYKKR
ncbi:MAG: hypothetical protein LBC12_06660 [Nitrososphaerota archaeon]|jgi:hypothetical protein|nr:hypothetical protein [Nitrososphaerota archaeon]